MGLFGGISLQEQRTRQIDDLWRKELSASRGRISQAKDGDRAAVVDQESGYMEALLTSLGQGAWDTNRAEGIADFRAEVATAKEKNDAVQKQSLLEQTANQIKQDRNDAYGGAGYGAVGPDGKRLSSVDQTQVTGGILGLANATYAKNLGLAQKEDQRVFGLLGSMEKDAAIEDRRVFGGKDENGVAQLGLLGEMTRDAQFTQGQVDREVGRASADVMQAFTKARAITNRNNARMGLSPASAAWASRARGDELNEAAASAGAVNNTRRDMDRESRDRLYQVRNTAANMRPTEVSRVRGLGLQIKPSEMSVNDPRLGVYAADPIFSSNDPTQAAQMSGINQGTHFYDTANSNQMGLRNLNFQAQENQKQRDADELGWDDVLPIAAGAVTKGAVDYVTRKER